MITPKLKTDEICNRNLCKLLASNREKVHASYYANSYGIELHSTRCTRKAQGSKYRSTCTRFWLCVRGVRFNSLIKTLQQSSPSTCLAYASMIASIPGQTNLLCDVTASSQLRPPGGLDVSLLSSAAASASIRLIHNRFSVEKQKVAFIWSEHK